MAVELVSGFDINAWIPVASVVIGFFSKGFLDFLADHRQAKEQRATKREDRAEAARLRRIEFQRSVLIELQEVIQSLGRLTAQVFLEDEANHRSSGLWGRAQVNSEVSESLRQAQSRSTLLRSRVASALIREQFGDFGMAVAGVTEAKDEQRAMFMYLEAQTQAENLHVLIGAELRRLDESEEGILL